MKINNFKNIFKNNKIKNYLNGFPGNIKSHFEMKRYQKNYKMGWNNNIKIDTNINSILNISDKDSKKIQNDIETFNFDSKNIIYTTKNIPNIKSINRLNTVFIFIHIPFS